MLAPPLQILYTDTKAKQHFYIHLAATAVHAKDPPSHGKLLLSETDSLLDRNGEFLIERLECLVRWQVKTVETVHLVSDRRASILAWITYQVCDFGN